MIPIFTNGLPLPLAKHPLHFIFLMKQVESLLTFRLRFSNLCKDNTLFLFGLHWWNDSLTLKKLNLKQPYVSRQSHLTAKMPRTYSRPPCTLGSTGSCRIHFPVFQGPCGFPRFGTDSLLYQNGKSCTRRVSFLQFLETIEAPFPETIARQIGEVIIHLQPQAVQVFDGRIALSDFFGIEKDLHYFLIRRQFKFSNQRRRSQSKTGISWSTFLIG